jgi:DNA-binding MarR family transcriptional regulator
MTTTASNAASKATAPLADARGLALAHYAARGVLEQALARHGITFQQQVALRAAVTADVPQTPNALVTQISDSLKADSAEVRDSVDELLAKRLIVVDGAHLHPTEAGRDLMAAVGAEIAPVSARIWGGVPVEDLAAAGRVLALVAERANKEFAALTA